MNYKKFNSKFIIKIDKGEEIVESFKKICKENNIKLGTIRGIGATNKAEVGLFETKTKKYHKKLFKGDHEIASLSGNISTMKNEIYLHIHVVLGDKEHNAYAGHLSSAIVSATFEGVIEKIDGEVEREFSEEIGLNLFKM